MSLPAKLLTEIEAILLRAVPEIVAKQTTGQPYYAAFILYYGSDQADDRTPTLILPTESRRDRIAAQKGKTAPHHIWVHDEFIGGADTVEVSIPDESLRNKCRLWYHFHESDPTVTLAAFRTMVQRVSWQLNNQAPSRLKNTTSDFVYVPGDMSHDFCDTIGDMKESIPAARLQMLRDNRWLGADPWYELPAE